MKLFCSGVGINHPDIKIIQNEEIRVRHLYEECAEEIIEVQIGYDGIVIANALKAADLAEKICSCMLRWFQLKRGGVDENPYCGGRESDYQILKSSFGTSTNVGTRDALLMD